MTERPFSLMLAGQQPDEHNYTLLTPESHEGAEQPLPLGQMTITLNDPDFRQGYQEGASGYEQWHGNDQTIEVTTLLALVRNGWGNTRHSVFWQTGYIVGWLHSMFAHAYNVGEVLE